MTTVRTRNERARIALGRGSNPRVEVGGQGSYLGGETDAGLRPLMTEVFIGLFAGPKKARPYSLLPSGC